MALWNKNMTDSGEPGSESKTLLCEGCIFKNTDCGQSYCQGCQTNLESEISKDVVISEALAKDNNICESKPESPKYQQLSSIPEKHSIDMFSEEKTYENSIFEWQQKLTKLKDNYNFDADQCNLHELQQDYYCSDCNTVTCSECVAQEHVLHQCDMTSTILVEIISQLVNAVQPACRCASRVDIALQQLKQDKESIQCNSDLSKESVTKLFKEIRKTVDEREELILKTLDSYICQKLDHVEQQKSYINEVQYQLELSLREIHRILDSTSVNVSVFIDKQQLIDDIDIQEQNILDIENSLKTSMFSSTYFGFINNSHTLQEKLDELIVLCEYYPDADSGYYTSRKISLETEENLYAEKKPRCMVKSLSVITSDILPDENKYIKEQDDNRNSIVGQPPLKRSFSTPIFATRQKHQKRKRTSECVSITSGPLIPIRFHSLQMTTPIKTPLRVFDKLSISKKEVVHPCGVCMGENNSIIITDVRNHCVRIISSSGRCIGDIGKEGKRLGLFEDPCAVAMNKNSHIFVCQRENPRIQKLTSAGKYLKKLGYKSLGEPWAMVIGPDDKLYVTDWGRSCIHIFFSNGDYHMSIGDDDSMLGESLKFPAGIAMNASGQLIVTDRGNHCLWLLETNGDILKRIGSQGHGAGELDYPYGVAIHHNGSIIVSESGNNRISVFSSCGKFLNHFGQRGSEPGMFEHPRHVCISPNGEVIVADELNHRLQLFEI